MDKVTISLETISEEHIYDITELTTTELSEIFYKIAIATGHHPCSIRDAFQTQSEEIEELVESIKNEGNNK